LERLKDSSLCFTFGTPKVDAQAALAAQKLNLFRKKKQKYDAKLQTFFKVAAV
jgi:hypothetical protein